MAKRNPMNASALLWLSVISAGFVSTLATWMFLNKCAHRLNINHAKGTLWVQTVAVRTNLPLQELMQYAALVIGFLFALKTIWGGGWILALCFVLAGLILMEPIRAWLHERHLQDITPVMDLALVCMECDSSNKTVLQTLDEASATLGHAEVRRIVSEALECFYNGATEGEALQRLLTQNSNSVWALLIWTLFEQQHRGGSAQLRSKLIKLMRHRLQLHRRALPALEVTRRSLGLSLIFCVAVTAYLTISPASTLYVSSLQGQVIGSLALIMLAWIACIWSAHIQTLQRITQ